MKMYITGERNSGKTTLMTRYLIEKERFLLIDTTYLENKSIINRRQELFDKIYILRGRDDIQDIDFSYKRVGIDLSYLLEDALEYKDKRMFEKFEEKYSKYTDTLDYLADIIDKRVKYKKCLAMDEVELTERVIKLMDKFEEVYYCNSKIKKIDHFDVLIYIKKFKAINAGILPIPSSTYSNRL